MKLESEETMSAIKAYLHEGAAVRVRLESESETIFRAAELIAARVQAGGTIFLCGNGGSAADCQHMAAEFTSRLTKDFDRPAIAALALTTDTSFITAYANDTGFEGIFSRQLEALGRPGDVLIGISTSGASENVLRAVRFAATRQIATIVLCGDRGPLLDLADVAVRVPSTSTQFIQECHLAIEHLICHYVERAIYG